MQAFVVTCPIPSVPMASPSPSAPSDSPSTGSRPLRVALALVGLALVVGGVLWWRGRAVSWAVVEATVDRRFPDVRHVPPDTLAAWLADSTAPAPLLLDVRTAEEYAVSHLPGARRVPPDASAEALRRRHLAGVPRDTLVVAYCSVGYRSSALAARLAEAGYPRVYNLRGSIFRWANGGRPVVRAGRRVEAVHPYDAAWGRLLAPRLRAYDAPPPSPADTASAVPGD